jgi:HNH endonuclease
MAARDQLRDYFLSHLGQVLGSDELRIAAGGITEWARRVRELRNQEGYKILTHNDRSDLKPGQYLLLTAKPEPAFERAISKETRALVLDRNGFTCQMCGAGAGEPHSFDLSRRTRLHLGHVIDKSMGGTDDPSNLRAVCSVCNEGASNITPDRPSVLKLKAQIRKARGEDQIALLEWLVEKYAKQAKALTS